MKLRKHIESMLIVGTLVLGVLVAVVQAVTDPGVASRIATLSPLV